MDTTPLPNQEDDMSDNGIILDYCLRITSCAKFTTQQLLDFLEQEFKICRYVMGRETVPQEHFHLIISTDDSVEEQEVRDIIKAFLFPLWQKDGKLPRGFGNKQYNLQLCNDLNAGVSYAVKMKEKWYEGFDEDYIAERLAASFEKKKPSDFKSEYVKLCNDFQESDMNIHEFMTKYSVLKAKYGQQVVMHHAYAYAISNLIKREPEQASNFVENYLYKL